MIILFLKKTRIEAFFPLMLHVNNKEATRMIKQVQTSFDQLEIMLKRPVHLELIDTLYI